MSQKQKIDIDWMNVIKLGVILLIIASIAALSLAFTNVMTREVIAQQKEQKNIQARQAVMKDATEFKPLELELDEGDVIIEVFEALKNGEFIGYTFKSSTKGYSGNVEVLTGVKQDGSIEAITILTQTETPGLGARCVEPEFQSQFSNKSIDSPLDVVKSGAGDSKVQSITGATITSTAVTTGVNAAIELSGELLGGAK